MTESIIELRQAQLSRAMELVKKYKDLRISLGSDTNQIKDIDHLLIKLDCLCANLRKHISELHEYNTISDKMKEL